jgi:hypothetical protein
MPYKNIEDAKKNSLRYRNENREEINKRQRERYVNLTEEKKVERREERKKWEQENRDYINVKRKERKAKHKQHLIDMLGGKCCGCGATENLQFDHLDRTTKSFNISTSLASKIEKLEEEAKKCQLLCQECHQVKTLINHDCEQITYGKRVVEVKIVGNKTIVTLEEVAPTP